MREIAEKTATEGIISQILQDATSVGVGVRLLQLLRCRIGESIEKQFLERIVPHRINDGFVSQNDVAA